LQQQYVARQILTSESEPARDETSLEKDSVNVGNLILSREFDLTNVKFLSRSGVNSRESELKKDRKEVA
jgi:hypothetical protein